MQVILQESYMNLGEAGEIVNVKPGYARNFLLPQKIAVTATKGNLKMFEDKAKEITKKREGERDKALKTKDVLAGLSLYLKVQTSEEGKLYGSISTRELQEELAKKGADLDKRQIVIKKPIKMVGDYTILVRLVGGIKVDIPLKIDSTTPTRLDMLREQEKEASSRATKKADETLKAEGTEAEGEATEATVKPKKAKKARAPKAEKAAEKAGEEASEAKSKE